jgi:hypothetical protein
VRIITDDGVWALTESGNPTGGSFAVTIPGFGKTAAIPWNASAATIEAALAAVVPGSTATGGPINDTPVAITLANVNLTVPIETTSQLTGGSSPIVTDGLTGSGPVIGTVVVEDFTWRADGLRYSYQGRNDGLFVMCPGQAVGRIDIVRPTIRLNDYVFDGGSSVDLALVHASGPSTAYPFVLHIRDMDVALGGVCNFEEGAGQGVLHDVLAEGMSSRTVIDGLTSDHAAAVNGNLSILTVTKNGGSGVEVSATKLTARTASHLSANHGVRVYDGGTAASVRVTESDFTAISTGLAISPGVNAAAVATSGNRYASGPASGSIAVSAGTFTWRNTTGMVACVAVSGGTVTAIAIGDHNANFGLGVLTSGTFIVPAGSYLRVTSVLAPTMAYSLLP